ncbi:MAG: group II intron maturase-specific domain-containing protein [Planctomycetaceae bacterium]
MSKDQRRGLRWTALLSPGFTAFEEPFKCHRSPLKRFKRQMRQITGRSRGISMEDRLGRLRSYVRSWMGYYGSRRS